MKAKEKQNISLVKYNGNNQVFAWRYPADKFTTSTRLVVNELYEAAVCFGGKVYDILKSGEYTMDAETLPLFFEMLDIEEGQEKEFTAEIWYINKQYVSDVNFKTMRPVSIEDPKYRMFLPLHIAGSFKIQIDDSRIFLEKVAQAMPAFDQVNMLQYFRNIYFSKIKESIRLYLERENHSLFELDAYMDKLTIEVQEQLSESLELFGLKVFSIFLTGLMVPEDDPEVIKLKDTLKEQAIKNTIGFV